MRGINVTPDNTRAKTPDRFLEKSRRVEDNLQKYTDPFTQIQDQIGARVVTYYLSDVDRVSSIIKRYYSEVEEKTIAPENETEFSYIGKHFILFLPDEILITKRKKHIPLFFELQIKTLFQHAWAEAEHDLNYKANKELSTEDKRLVAFSAAQAWGADRHFDELFQRYGTI